LNPKVVVAIPTLNAGAPLQACLAALARQSFRDFETIVIDNGGVAPDNAAAIRIRPGENIGFGAAINLAARTSKAPYIASLNDDAEPEPQWLGELVRVMDADARVGMCASCVLLDDQRLDSAGLLLCPDGSTKQRGHGDAPARYATEEEALMPSGSAALYRRELFDTAALGGFDESFFLYCEDSDLGLRAQWLGWKCRYVPTARVLHRYSLSAGRASKLKAYLVERNRLALAVKCLPFSMLIAAPFAALERYWWHWRLPGVAQEFRRDSNAFTLIWIVCKAHLALFIELPWRLRDRWRTRRAARISSAEFTALARRFRISPREVASQ
jgi:GT2 family glycosyltransferase